MDYTYPSSPYYGGSTPGKEGLHNRKTPKNTSNGNSSSSGGDIFFGTNSHNFSQGTEVTNDANNNNSNSTALDMGTLMMQKENNNGYGSSSHNVSISNPRQMNQMPMTQSQIQNVSSSSSSSYSNFNKNNNFNTPPDSKHHQYHQVSGQNAVGNNSATYNDYTSLSPSSKSNLMQPLVIQDSNYSTGQNNSFYGGETKYDADDSHKKYKKKSNNSNGFGKNRILFVAIVSCCLFGSLLFIFGIFDYHKVETSSSAASSSTSGSNSLKGTRATTRNPKPSSPTSFFSPKLEDNFMTENANNKKQKKKDFKVNDFDTAEESFKELHKNTEPVSKIRLTKEDIESDSWFLWGNGDNNKHDEELHGPAHLHENKKKKVSVHREKPRVIKIRSIMEFQRRGKHHKSLSDHVKASEDGPVELDISSDTSGLRRIYYFGDGEDETREKALSPVEQLPNEFSTTGSISFLKSIKGMKGYNHFEIDDFMGSSMTYMGIDKITGLNVVAVSAPGAMDKAGVVYFLRLESDGKINSYTYIDGDQAQLKYGEENYQADIGFGWSITNVGDVNGDGIDDIAIGAVGFESTEGKSMGAIYLAFLDENYEAKDVVLISRGMNGFNFPLKDKSAFGSSLASMGDMDGDGVPDIAIGAWSYSHQRGAIFFLYLNADGSVKTYKQVSSLKGMELRLNPEDAFGHSMLAIGDLDGDGISELAVGADGFPNGDFRGAVFILWPNRDGSIKRMKRIDELDERIDDDFLFGSAMTSIGDINGDGINELVIGSPGADEYHGVAYILSINSDAEVQIYKPLLENDHPVLGQIINRSHEFSWSLTYAGDLNQDGVPDLMIGAELQDKNNENVGVLHVLHLQPHERKLSSENKTKKTNSSGKKIRGATKSANVQSSWF